MKKILAFTLIILALALFAVGKDLKTEKENLSFSGARLGNTTLSLLVADSNEEKRKGLSGKKSLGEDEAMLFIFDRKNDYGIWMKEMNFPIDIIWLDEDFRVVDIKAEATPDSYPEVFKPRAPSLYIIEANAGIAEKEEIKIGEVIEIF